MEQLSNNIKLKLEELVELWAEENLIGKPAILGSAMFYNIEKTIIDKSNEIEQTFKKDTI